MIKTCEVTEEEGNAVFCGKCGSHMMYHVPLKVEGMNGLVIVPVGVIDGSEGDERLRPGAEGWCRRREAWMGKMEGTVESEEW